MAVSSFRKLFLALKTFSQSFLRENFTITRSLFLSQRQVSKSSLLKLQSQLRKIWHSFVSVSSFVKDLGYPTVSRVSLLEYSAFTQYCLSALTRRDENSEFAFLAIATSTSSLLNLSFRSFNFSKTLGHSLREVTTRDMFP